MLSTRTPCTAVWAADSWSERMTVITPVFGGILASAEAGTPSSVPISVTSWLRSSVTTPLPVEIPWPVLFSSTLTSF